MGNHEDAESGIKFEREYNQICGKMLQEEREKRGISREELARGILSKTALSHMETGRIGSVSYTHLTLPTKRLV